MSPRSWQGVGAALGGGRPPCLPRFHSNRRHRHTPLSPSHTRSPGPRAGCTKQLQGLAQPVDVPRALHGNQGQVGCHPVHTRRMAGPLCPDAPENLTAEVASWSLVPQSRLSLCTLGPPRGVELCARPTPRASAANLKLSPRDQMQPRGAKWWPLASIQGPSKDLWRLHWALSLESSLSPGQEGGLPWWFWPVSLQGESLAEEQKLSCSL